MSKPARRAILKTNSLAFDSHHIFSVLLAVLTVIVPIVEKWTGPVSWKTAATVAPGALVSLWMLFQKSPKDLAAYLETLKEPTVTVVDSSSVTENGEKDNDDNESGSADKTV